MDCRRLCLLFLASASHVVAESLCPAGSPDALSSAFSQVGGIADNDCCVYYVALQPATLVHIDVDDSGVLTVGANNTDIIPAAIARDFEGKSILGDIDYWNSMIYVPVRNASHGAIVTTHYNFSAGPASEIQDSAFTWSAVDYGSELVYAGSANGTHLFIFSADSLQMKGKVALTSELQGAVGAALKEPGFLYVITAEGALHVVNVISGDVTAVAGTHVGPLVRGLANIWDYGHGSFHVVTPSQIQHYGNCGIEHRSGPTVVT